MGKSKSKKKKHRHPVTDVKLDVDEKKRIISHLHQLNKAQHVIDKNKQLTTKEKTNQIKQIKKQIKEIGGLNAYQHVSKTAESLYGNFNSAKWVFQQLRTLNILPKSGCLSLLDVGALDLNYTAYSKHINCTSIDLNPQKPGISKADLCQYKVGETGIYDVVVLSLVLNFSGDPAVRGDILRRAAQLTKQHAHLVIVLPLACVVNSRYLTESLLADMLSSLGFSVIASHQSKKLFFSISIKNTDPEPKPFPKSKIADGVRHNNFCIVLR